MFNSVLLPQSGQRSPICLGIGRASCSLVGCTERRGRHGIEVLGQHLRHRVRQAAHPLRPEAEMPSAADAVKLVDDLMQPLGGRQ